jgi:hypothetical protein
VNAGGPAGALGLDLPALVVGCDVVDLEPRGGRGRAAAVGLQPVDLGVELLDPVGQVADLVAGGHAEAVQHLGEPILEGRADLLGAGAEAALGLAHLGLEAGLGALHLALDAGARLAELLLALGLEDLALVDELLEQLAALLLDGRQRAQPGQPHAVGGVAQLLLEVAVGVGLGLGLGFGLAAGLGLGLGLGGHRGLAFFWF